MKLSRRVIVPALFLSTTCFTACSGSTPSNDLVSSTVTEGLTLEGKGDHLVLSHAPVNDYSATYPNPDGLSKMKVTVKGNGHFVTSCEGSDRTGRCSDAPFVSYVQKTRRGTVVHVFDVYGQRVMDSSFAGDCSGDASGCSPCSSDSSDGDNAGATGTGSSGTSDGTNTSSSGAPSGGTSATGSSSTSNGADGGSTGSSSSGSAGGGDSCSSGDLKAKFCKLVNDNLTNHQIAYTLDCNAVSDSFSTSAAPPPPVSQNLVPCHDIVEPAMLACQGECVSSTFELSTWDSNAKMILIQAGACLTSPLALDLDGDGIHVGKAEEGVDFDLLGNGTKVRTAWLGGSDAWLALDRDGNGRIDDATELFGDRTGGTMRDDGFAALATLDANGDGRVDAHDPGFASLVLWRDADHDGKSSPRELSTLPEAHVRALLVEPKRLSGPSSIDANGNHLPLVSAFEREGGGTGALVDVFPRFVR